MLIITDEMNNVPTDNLSNNFRTYLDMNSAQPKPTLDFIIHRDRSSLQMYAEQDEVKKDIIDLKDIAVTLGDNVKAINVNTQQSTLHIGNNVLLINCNFFNSAINIPDNTVLYNVTVTNSRFKLLTDESLIRNTGIKDCDLQIKAKRLIFDHSSASYTNINIECVECLLANVKDDASRLTRCTIDIKSDKKYTIMVDCVVLDGTDLRLYNPKYIYFRITSGYYSSRALIVSIKAAENSYIHVNSYHTPVAVEAAEDSAVIYKGNMQSKVCIKVGSKSRLDMAHLCMPYYANNTLKTIDVGNNVTAAIYKVKATTSMLSVKDDFVGIITNKTGTNRGGHVIVRKVHGE